MIHLIKALPFVLPLKWLKVHSWLQPQSSVTVRKKSLLDKQEEWRTQNTESKLTEQMKEKWLWMIQVKSENLIEQKGTLVFLPS